MASVLDLLRRTIDSNRRAGPRTALPHRRFASTPTKSARCVRTEIGLIADGSSCYKSPEAKLRRGEANRLTDAEAK
jgi:hypothetical protein